MSSTDAVRDGVASFTPGPWMIGRYGLRDFEVQGGEPCVQVAVLRGAWSKPKPGSLEGREFVDVPVPEAWANAALITAAPDLLTALEAMTALPGWEEGEPYAIAARAAIAKARAQTNDASPTDSEAGKPLLPPHERE